MKIIDDNTPAPPVKPSMFLHGSTGNGKSIWSIREGVPLVILTEPKAMSVLRQINPRAQALIPESIKDLLTIMEILGQPERLEKRGIDRIILDSYTGLTEALPAWIRKDANAASVLAKAMEIQEYGTIDSYAIAIVEAIQLTGYPSVIIGRSVSKKIGLVERIVPDSVGKSVAKLPGRLLPTAEARYDAELGYVIDTTPAEHSQRCGLPWLPAIWQGTCLDYLRMIEAGPQGEQGPAPEQPSVQAATTPVVVQAPSAPLAAPEPPPTKRSRAPKAQPTPEPAPATLPAEDPEWCQLLADLSAAHRSLGAEEQARSVASWEAEYALHPHEAMEQLRSYMATVAEARAHGIDPEKDPEGYRKAFGQYCQQLEDAKRAKPVVVSAEADAFVDGLKPAPKFATPEDVREVLDLILEHKLPEAALLRYAADRGHVIPDPKAQPPLSWLRLQAESLPKLLSALKTEPGRRALVAAVTT